MGSFKRSDKKATIPLAPLIFLILMTVSVGYAVNVSENITKLINFSEINFTGNVTNETIEVNITENTTIENTTEENITLPENVAIPEINITEPPINETPETNITTNESEELNLEIDKKIHKEFKKIIKENPKEKTHVIIQLKTEEKRGLLDEIKSKQGKITESLDEKLVMAEVTAEDLEDLAKDSNVEKIWPDRETMVVLDYSVKQINAPALWKLGLNGTGVKIAILDTGIANHEMLQGRIILQRDFTNGNDPNDYNSHGTHVSGIAAGSNLTGQYNGVAPAALLLNGKVLDNSGSGRLSWLINGIDWAMDPDNNPNTDDGADVISLSLGAIYSGEPEDLLSAPEVLKVKEAVSKGITVVIASGNCGSGCGGFYGVTTPGITKEAITIGAVNDNNNWATFSSGDLIADYIKPDLVAPGVEICSSVPNGYNCFSGTSMSTPHVSGAVALLLQNDNSLSPFEIKSMLENSALDLGETGKDVKYGSGLIDLSKIFEANVSEEPTIEEHYKLIIPAFEIGKESEIVLEFKNVEKKGKKITVKFLVEELDYEIEGKKTKKIPSGKTGEFKFKFTPKLIGRYLLKVDIYDGKKLTDHVEQSFDVGGIFEDRMAEVNVLIR